MKAIWVIPGNRTGVSSLKRWLRNIGERTVMATGLNPSRVMTHAISTATPIMPMSDHPIAHRKNPTAWEAGDFHAPEAMTAACPEGRGGPEGARASVATGARLPLIVSEQLKL